MFNHKTRITNLSLVILLISLVALTAATPRAEWSNQSNMLCIPANGKHSSVTCSRDGLLVMPPTPTPIPSRVEEMLAPFFGDPVYNTINGLHYCQLTGISTGDIYTINRYGYQLDVLDIYLLLTDTGPIRVPLVVGVEDEQGYTSLVLFIQDTPPTNREEMLEAIVELYPRWQMIDIMLFGSVVKSYGIDWEKCTGDDHFPLHCGIGQALENEYST
ncbi:MAG: hypothetical protein U9O54_05375, partial [Chloroflexota bacterium]|nr:hypothetical protein [Chloroflexota bacterium]